MTTTLRNLTIAIVSLLALAATPAQAAVGVEAVSTHHGPPGAMITLTLGCGLCSDDAPASFGVSLVRGKEAPQRHSCGDGPICTPTPLGPPDRPPLRLQRATNLG
jgi:hypothetical protein